jgi:hypothetical protein
LRDSSGKTWWILSLIILIFFGAQLFFFFTAGVRQSVDTPFYLENATLLKQGILPEDRGFWYLGYSLFLTVIFFFGGTLKTVVAIQILLSCLSAFCIYLSAKKINQSNLAAILSMLLYLVWIPIHEWDTFIYTESLFTSFCILSFTALLFSRKQWHFVLIALLFLFTFFIRPAGFSLVVSLTAYFIVGIPRKWFSFIIPFAGILTLVVILIGNEMFHSYDPIPAYASAEIIYPKITLDVTAPADLIIPETGTPLQKVFFFALHNPFYFLKLFIIKVALFYGNVKPYYSLIHNLVIVLFLYPIYYFALKGLQRTEEFRKEKFFMVSLILANGLIVGLTTENWDGRFLVPSLPFIFILASGPLFLFLTKYFTRKKVFRENHLSH